MKLCNEIAEYRRGLQRRWFLTISVKKGERKDHKIRGCTGNGTAGGLEPVQIENVLLELKYLVGWGAGSGVVDEEFENFGLPLFCL